MTKTSTIAQDHDDEDGDLDLGDIFPTPPSPTVNPDDLPGELKHFVRRQVHEWKRPIVVKIFSGVDGGDDLSKRDEKGKDKDRADGEEGDVLDIQLISGHSLWGHVLYPASILLSRFLETYGASMLTSHLQSDTRRKRGARVLELGAGGGLPGIVAALEMHDNLTGQDINEASGKVVTTDYPDEALIRNLERNAQANLAGREEVLRNYHVEGFVWGSKPENLLVHLTDPQQSVREVKFDLILMSDLVFNHSEHLKLIKTCEECLAGEGRPTPDPTVDEDGPEDGSSLDQNWQDEWAEEEDLRLPCCLVFYSHHRPRFVEKDLDFLRLAMRRGWKVKRVAKENYGPAFPEDTKWDLETRSIVHGWIMSRA